MQQLATITRDSIVVHFWNSWNSWNTINRLLIVDRGDPLFSAVPESGTPGTAENTPLRRFGASVTCIMHASASGRRGIIRMNLRKRPSRQDSAGKWLPPPGPRAPPWSRGFLFRFFCGECERTEGQEARVCDFKHLDRMDRMDRMFPSPRV